MIKKILKIAKSRGFIFQSSEIYGGLSGIFDYGNLGFLMKKKIEDDWRRFFVKEEKNIFEVETSLIMHPKVFEASGHLKSFVDPLVQCKKCNSFFRADNLIEEIKGISAENKNIQELDEIIKKEKIRCPKCNSELDKTRYFNLMIKAFISPLERDFAYFRPETAQGIFINFKNILNSLRLKLPFGIAQIGRSFRNEISPRQWLIRLREFNQMEIEYFFDPFEANFEEKKYLDIEIPLYLIKHQKENKEKIVWMKGIDAVDQKILPNEIMAHFLAKEFLWYKSLNIPEEFIRFREIEEKPHYSKSNFDMEIKFDFGWKEVVGNAYRAEYDLKMHQKFSKESFYVQKDGKKVLPHVVEPSFGMERTFYAILLYNFIEDEKRGWDWFKFPPKISPYLIGIFPLVRKDNLDLKAKEVFEILRKEFDCLYDEKGSIGKRYARADEIGIPYCVTIDYQTLQDNTVTIRDRNNTKQERMEVENLKNFFEKLLFSSKY